MAFDVGTAVGYLMLDTSKWDNSLKQAKSSLNTFGDETATAADKFSAAGSSLTSAGKAMTLGVTAPLVGIGTAAVKTASNFESAMSQVQATMGITVDSMSQVHGETVNTMDALEAIAKEMGSRTAFSAKEAADALNYLALAGYDTEQQIDALPSVLTLAAAGNMDLAYASDLVTDSMSVLGLTTEDLGEYIDQMAKTASSSNTSVEQLGEAILVAGGQAKLCGMNTADLNTALGILADNGIKGSEGGTMLRNVLKNLYTPTNEASKALNELGVETSDVFGNLRDTQDVLNDLSNALSGLTEEDRVQAMANIFDTRTIAGANALLKNSTDRWNELSGAIGNSAGAAQQMADTQLDNLEGQLTILKSGIEAAAIAFGQLLLPMIKDVTSGIQSLVDWVNGLSESQKQTIVRVAEFLAVLGPVLLIVGQISSAISTVITLVSTISPLLTGLISPIGLVIAAVAALALAWATDFGGIREKTEAVFNFISDLIQSCIADFNSLVDAVVSIASSLYEAGRQIMQSLWDGIKSIWGDMKSWFEDKINWIKDKVQFWNSQSSKLSASPVREAPSGIGSYASGLDYVPRDMNVKVHEGESILTKDQRESLFKQDPTPQQFKFDLYVPLDGEIIAHSQYTFNTKEGTLRGDDLVTGGAYS